MTHVFLSYAHEDIEIAKYIEDELKARGATVFRDQPSMVAGEYLPERISSEIDASDHVVLIISVHSAASLPVEQEMIAALARKKQIVGVVINEESLNTKFWPFKQNWWINFKDAEKENFKGKAIRELAHAMKLPKEPIYFKLSRISAQGEGVAAMAVSPTGNMVATISRDETLAIWSLPDGDRLHHIPNKGDGFFNWGHDVAFDLEGQILASAWEDSIIRLYDPLSGEPKGALENHEGPLQFVRFLSDGSTLLCVCEDSLEGNPLVVFWDYKKREQKEVLSFRDCEINSVVVSPTEQVVFISGGEGHYKARTPFLWFCLYDHETSEFHRADLLGEMENKQNSEGDKLAANRVAISSDGELAVAGTYYKYELTDEDFQALSRRPAKPPKRSDGPSHLVSWNLSELGIGGRAIEYDGSLIPYTFSPDGRVLACADGSSIVLLQSETDKWTHHLTRNNPYPIKDLAFSPRGDLLLASLSNGQIIVWAIEGYTKLSEPE